MTGLTDDVKRQVLAYLGYDGPQLECEIQNVDATTLPLIVAAYHFNIQRAIDMLAVCGIPVPDMNNPGELVLVMLPTDGPTGKNAN